MFNYDYDDYLIDQANYHFGGSKYIDENWENFTQEDWQDYEDYLNSRDCNINNKFAY